MQKHSWLCVLLVVLCAACGDEEGTTPLPPDDDVEDDVHFNNYYTSNIYTGEVSPCDVVSVPGEVLSEGVSLSEVASKVYLRSVRVGSTAEYRESIQGSTASDVLSGSLPPGMTLSEGELSGMPTLEAVSGEQAEQYSFRVEGEGGAPLEVIVSVYPTRWSRPDEVPEYWKRGPYNTWNTAPLEREAEENSQCNANPVIPEIHEEENVELFVSYPVLGGEPTVTGEANVALGRWPVIVFAHANNDWACDMNERYRSLHDHWASWGYIVVSVDMTQQNCALGYAENFHERMERSLAAIDVMENLDKEVQSRFYGRIDLDRMVLVGHSRGGFSSLKALYEGFDKARAVISLQGVTVMAFGLGNDPVPRFPVLGITAELDTDLEYPEVESTEDRLTGPYTWVDIGGGSHAQTGDTAPLDPGEVSMLSKQRQHDMTELYTTAFLARYVGVGDGSASHRFAPDMASEAVLYDMYGAELSLNLLSEQGVKVRWSRDVVGVLIDDFNSIFEGDALFVNDLGGENVADGLVSAEEVLTYAADDEEPPPHQQKTVSMRLVGGEERGSFRMYLNSERAPLQVGQGSMLLARVKGPDSGASAVFEVEVETTSGDKKVLGSEHIGPMEMSNRFTQLMVSIDDLDVGEEIVSVAFHVEGGTLFVDDVRIE